MTKNIDETKENETGSASAVERLVMWKFKRLNNAQIVVSHEDGGACIVEEGRNSTVKEIMLYRLASDLLDT